MTDEIKEEEKLKIEYVDIDLLVPCEYNPRKWEPQARKDLKEGLTKFGVKDPLIANSAPNRKNKLIGGNFRHDILKEMGYKMVPVVFVNIPDIEKEKELNIRLNKNTGDWDFELLKEFDETFLSGVGFSSQELDDVFAVEDTPGEFDLNKELEKLNIKNIEAKRGDVYKIGPDFKLMNGDSTVEADVLKLMGGELASLCLTDPPYLLDYLHGKQKKGGKVTEGFGLKRDRIYLETESLPDNFTELWMANVAKIQKPDFSIIVFENPKNLRTIWNELEKHWKYRNTICWHVPNRVQNFAAKYKFFNKTDIALVGTGGEVKLNLEPEADELFQNEYDNALFATSGKPHWESYEKGKKICPTDFVEHKAADEKSSGQAIIFGTKDISLLIPYVKVLTERGSLLYEPFGGSGSSGVAALKLGRRCYMMEKSSVYTEVIKQRIEKLLGQKAEKIC